MAVISDNFGGLHLTGEDARKFRNQTRAKHVSPAATAAVTEGLKAARQLAKDGIVRIAK